MDKLILLQQLYIGALLCYFKLENTKPISILMNSYIYLISGQSFKLIIKIVYIANIVYYLNSQKILK